MFPELKTKTITSILKHTKMLSRDVLKELEHAFCFSQDCIVNIYTTLENGNFLCGQTMAQITSCFQ